jgi:membrane-bound lytic murein transglycosylase F
LKRLAAGLLIFLLAACDGMFARALPFPTPAQQNLVVLTTSGPLTYSTEENSEPTGLERDLIEAFARELGVGIEYRDTTPADLPKRIAAGEAHIAMGWLDTPGNNKLKATLPLFQSRDILIQHEATLPISDPDELRNKTIHALSGSRQLRTLLNLQKTIPSLKVVEVKDEDIFDLLESVADQEHPLAVIDSTLTDIATQLNPSLQTSLELSGDTPIVWWLGEKPNIELQTRLNAFVEKSQHDGTLAKIEDRYFGHVRRLKQADIVKFLGRTEMILPKLREDFIAAQSISGIDWRLIAAVAYHESQWEAEATSPTGVRGIMMLTEETADRLGVKNRLDPRESILAGARYINILKDLQPDGVREPDRTWLALAAYNIGPGSFNAARTLAKQLGADPTAWYEMKRILPLLAKPQYYQLLKSGRARGGEAVILVENIRSYYDILVHNESAFQTQAPRMQNLSGAPGLKLKR